MKKYAMIFSALCTGLLFTSCNKDPEYFTLEENPDEMHVKSSVEEITLSKSSADQTAVTFTWDAATSVDPSTEGISYKLCLYPTGQKDSHSAYMELGNNLSYSMTHDELNTLLSQWALPGQAVKVTAQLLAVFKNEQRYIKPELSTVEFTATGYEKYSPYLYMQITTDDGKQMTQRLDQRQLGTGIYEATLNMTACKFHFTTTPEAYPAYGMAEGEQLEYYTEGEVRDFRFDGDGKRTVIVDTNTGFNDCRVLDIVQLPTPGLIWICGNGCSVGWNTNTSNGRLEMVGSAREPYYYAWTGDFNAGGEFKIGVGNGWGDPFFFAPDYNADPLTDHRLSTYRYQDNGGDVKWVPSVSGRYTLTLCLLATDMWTKFEPAN